VDLYLQFGYGMKNIVIDLSKEWNGVTSILSPRDISPDQLIKWSKEFQKHNVECLFDPQCYFPKCDHKNLIQYDYWNRSLSTNLGSDVDYETSLIKNIAYYNSLINSKEIIIPAIMRKYTEDWFKQWKANSIKLVKASRKLKIRKSLLLTLALPADLLSQREDYIEQLIDTAGKLDVDGFYIIAEPPAKQYLVENPLWLSNLMQLCAGLKLQNKKVIVGYANHQLLCLSAAKVDAIASGTYLNVRRFSNKFEDQEDEIKRKSTWFYYPPSLSEFKIAFLDIAFSNGIIDKMKPEGKMDNDYVKLIFSGAMPSTTSFKESMAFKHYLHCLREQVKICSRNSFAETISANEILLETAERRIEYLEKNGVYAQSRSFKDVVDVNRSAIQRLQKTRGFLMQYSWDTM